MRRWHHIGLCGRGGLDRTEKKMLGERRRATRLCRSRAYKKAGARSQTGVEEWRKAGWARERAVDGTGGR